MPVFDLKKATIKIKDGTTPTPNSLTIKMGEGNMTISEKFPYEYLKNRGKLDSVRDGDEEPMDVSFEGRWEFLKADTGQTVSIRDVFTNSGEAESWVTTDADTCAPFATDLEITFDPPCEADKSEVITLPDFRPDSLDYDAKAGTISVKGRCNATRMTISRV
jgi:hypothetical protein